MTPNRWGAPKRTKADRERDCLLFCTTARLEAVRACAPDDLASRYGVDRRYAEYHRQMRLQRGRQ